MSNKPIFFEILKNELSPKLREIGFKGSGQNFRRVNNETVNIINIQVSKYGGSCAVNLGLHFTFLPLNWSTDLPDIKKIREYDCEFRMRLSPKVNGDYWWKYDGFLSSPRKKAQHLIETYFRYGEARFKDLDTVEKLARSLSIEELKKSKDLNVFGIVAQPRGALSMARIQQHLGNPEMANKFASYGLENIGKATVLRPALEKIQDAT